MYASWHSTFALNQSRSSGLPGAVDLSDGRDPPIPLFQYVVSSPEVEFICLVYMEFRLYGYIETGVFSLFFLGRGSIACPKVGVRRDANNQVFYKRKSREKKEEKGAECHSTRGKVL